MSGGGGHKPHGSGGGGGGGHGGSGAERWLITYADVITLLMVFFIVLYSMSEMDKAKYQAIAQSLGQVFGGGNLVVNIGGVGDGVSIPLPEEILEGLGKELYNDFAHDGRFTVRVSERGLIISLAGSATFESGSAAIVPEMYPLLDAIAAKVQGTDFDISVEGFTDSDPIRTAAFPSNWYLSVARANTVRDYLETHGVAPERMIVVGYGDTRPVWSNETEEGKAKNRRVDVVILRNKHVIDLGQEIDDGKK